MSHPTQTREDYLPFEERYKAHTKYIANKWEHYLPIYERFFHAFASKNKPVHLLEIGVQNGGSLELWKEYLPQGSKIIGIDINEKCKEINFSEDITFLHGSASDKDFIEKHLKDNTFDIIIDDGSHHSQDVITSFEMLFPKLHLGGIYLVEDCHASYWASCGGGFRKDNSMVEYFKNLLDAIHFRYYDIAEEAKKVQDMPKLKKLLEEVKNFAEYNSQIASISFYDSVIAIEKYMQKRETLFSQTISEGVGIITSTEANLKLGMQLYNKDTKLNTIYRK